MALLKNLKSKSRSKVVHCPQCRGKLRVPIKLGKTLLVNCPKCSAEFELSYRDPWSQLKMKLSKPSLNPFKRTFKPKTRLQSFLLYGSFLLLALLIGFLLHPELGGQIGSF